MVQKHTTNPSWSGLEAIYLVGCHGTVRKAAAVAGVAHTTLAKRVAAAERALGIVAFVRGRKGYTPTAAGARIIAHAERMHHEARAVSQTLTGGDAEIAGLVRISLLPEVLTRILTPKLGELTARHPHLRLQFLADYSLSDLDHDDAEIALRFQTQPGDHLRGQRVATLCDAIFAAPGFVHSHQSQDRAVHLIGWTDPAVVRRRAKAFGLDKVDITYVTSDLSSQAELAASGQAAAILPCFVGDRHLGLLRYSDSAPATVSDLWVLSHPDYKASKRVQTVARFLAAALREEADLFAGRRPAQGATDRLRSRSSPHPR